jgi:tRNA nucleotidyltransferase (CCA-adding enzyme)
MRTKESQEIENPYFTREILAAQEKKLIEGLQKLARAVSALEPNPAYPGVWPRAFLVGGYVRDIICGLKPKDADVEVYGVAPDKLLELLTELFGAVNTVGEGFGILKVSLGNGLEMDVSIPRRESKSGQGHRGFLVASDPSLTIVEAARRRDFTMNAMAMDPLSGEIFDPFGGLADIKNKVLRVTDSEKFQEDALRILRAVQFSARLGFKLEPTSAELMKKMVGDGALEVDAITPERVSEEWKKLLLKAERPSIGLEVMRELGLLKRYFPELWAMINCPQEEEWHAEGDVWTHAKMVVDQAAKIMRRDGVGWTEKEKIILMLGALCHDLGKPTVTEFVDDRLRSRGHEEAGEKPARQFFDHLIFSEKLRQAGSRHSFSDEVVEGVVAIVIQHLKPGVFHRSFANGQLDERQYANIIRKVIQRIYPLNWRVFLAASEADFRGRGIPGIETSRYPSGELMSEIVKKYHLDEEPKKPLVQGRDVLAVFPGRSPGPWVGELIRRIEVRRDAGEISTREEALAALQ